jgi:hypothetical protein
MLKNKLQNLLYKSYNSKRLSTNKNGYHAYIITKTLHNIIKIHNYV